MSRLTTPVFLLVVWLAVWGEVSVVNVVSGIAVVAIVSLLFRRVQPGRHRIHVVGLVRLLAVFVWRLLTSSANVVLTVLAPTPERLRSGVVGVELSDPSPLVATIVSDAISLTPGTLTLEARFPNPGPDGPRPPTLFIHVLGLDDAEAIRDDVQRLEALVLSAITPNGLDREAAPDREGGS
ncbi:MAG: Na+/H+ antiporter subunit E [Actinomycetota bacterium]